MSGSSPLPRPLENSYWVVPGRFLAGEYPGAPFEEQARPRLRALLEGCVSRFLDLTEQGELEPYEGLLLEEAHKLGLPVKYERHPVRDAWIPNSPAEMSAILDAIDASVNGGETVYVHCWGGIGRTGTVVGCWLVRHGMTGAEALSQLAEMWPVMAKAHLKTTSPETPAQFEYVRNWKESEA